MSKAMEAVTAAMNSAEFKLKLEDTIRTMIELALEAYSKTVDSKIENALKAKTQEMVSLKEENLKLQESIKRCEKNNFELSQKMDELEQYSRRNCVIISGKQKNEDDTEKITMDLVKTMKLDEQVTAKDIDRSHWIGNKIIVKFSTYKARQLFYNQRKSAGNGIYINENLTRKRDELLYQCRKLKKDKRILAAWSSDGQIKIKLQNHQNVTVKTFQDALEWSEPDPEQGDEDIE